MASNNSTDARLVKNNLRSMIGYRYESDHDFYEQLKKAIGYTGATYDGVCERLIELMDDYALERTCHNHRHRGIRNRHGSGREPHAGAEQRLHREPRELEAAQAWNTRGGVGLRGDF